MLQQIIFFVGTGKSKRNIGTERKVEKRKLFCSPNLGDCQHAPTRMVMISKEEKKQLWSERKQNCLDFKISFAQKIFLIFLEKFFQKKKSKILRKFQTIFPLERRFLIQRTDAQSRNRKERKARETLLLNSWFSFLGFEKSRFRVFFMFF